MLDRVDRSEPVLFVEEVRKSKYRGLNPSFYKRALRNQKLRAEQQARAEKKARLERQKRESVQESAERCFRQMSKRMLKRPDASEDQGVREIIEAVSVKTGIPVSDILGPRRSREIIKARFQAIAEVRKRYPDMSKPQIGRAFNRDHSSILHALRAMGLN